mgnify:CR=1 FL=1
MSEIKVSYFSEFHARVLDTLMLSGAERLDLDHMAYGLLEESGEVAGELKRLMREDNGHMNTPRREAILKEMGDVLWYLDALATVLDSSLEEVATNVAKKLADRKARGVLMGRGGDR